ncbi:hypothetical protein CRG98_017719 [Punica granatum]|uniref:Uncharacterized protein n=1 Tax=Punica granatum TaxID=22663 RepID=A0A2I0K1A3_PUNGR|nr:hypothetical protein CRG98_017719 [Punica granatum]
MDPRGLQYARGAGPVDCGVHERLLVRVARCGALARRVARCTALLRRCRIWCWAIVLSLAMPRLCDDGFCFAGCCMLKDSSSGMGCLRISSGRESESAVVLAMWYL